MNKKNLLLLLFVIASFWTNAQDLYQANIKIYSKSDGLPQDQVQWVFKDSRGLMWIGTSNGISRYDGREFKLAAKANMYNINYQRVFEDAEGDLWLKRKTPNLELFFFNIYTQKIKTFEEKFGTSAPFTKEDFFEGTALSDKTIIIGTVTGKLIHYYPNKKFSVIDFEDESGLSPYKSENSDNFWILRCFSEMVNNKSEWYGEVLYYNEEELLYKYVIPKIIHGGIAATKNEEFLYYDQTHLFSLDLNGQVISRSAKDLSDGAFDKTWFINYSYDAQRDILWHHLDGKLHSFKRSGGILPANTDNYFDLSAAQYFHSLIDGDVFWLGSVNGLLKIELKPTTSPEVLEQPDIPLVLTECHVLSHNNDQDESLLISYQENGFVEMNPSDIYLKFEFELLNYKEEGAVEYAYAFDDEKQWSLNSENAILIRALPYGDHLLKIKGKIKGGGFSKQELRIPITVLKPFYLQYWFLILCGFSLFSLIFLIQKIRTKNLIARQKELELMVKERTRTIESQAEELRQIDKTKSQFLANISHEFRTPLTLILNTLEEEEVSKVIDNSNIEEGRFFGKNEVDILQRNSRRLEKLIEQLLDLSKLEAGKMELKAAPQNYYLYLKSLVASFKPLALKNKIDLQFYTNENDIELFFDRDKMDKIIYNLLYNAIKFTPEGGSIIVDVQKNRSDVFVSVKDTGIGIPSDAVEYIFDRFYQVKRKDEYAYEGTGLGLTLVRELTEMHKGRVEVASEAGKGTNFKLFFQLGSEHLHPNERQSLEPTSPTNIQENSEIPITESILHIEAPNELSNTKPILLIIEDNADLRYYQQKRFKKEFQVLLAANGQEGLELAFGQIPDLIICDVMMPGKNGYEVCQELKNDERTNHIPVILLTAKVAKEEKIQGLTVGADDYITKPYDQKELQLKVNNLLEQSKKLQERFKVAKAITPIEEEVSNQDPFVTRILLLIEENLTNQYFGVEQLSDTANLSRSQLFRKLKALTGETPTNFLRSYRLNKAKEILEAKKATPSETAYMVGFTTANYFFKCFKNEFGMTPTEMMETVKDKHI